MADGSTVTPLGAPLGVPLVAPLGVAAAPPLGVVLRRVLALAAPDHPGRRRAGASANWWNPGWRRGRAPPRSPAGRWCCPSPCCCSRCRPGAMGGGVVSAIARALGARQQKEAAALVIHAVVIALGFGLVYAVLLAGFPRQILGADRRAGGSGGGLRPIAPGCSAPGRSRLGWPIPWPRCCAAAGRHALASRVLLLAWLCYPPLGLGADRARRAGPGRRRDGLRRHDDGGGRRAWPWWCCAAAPVSSRCCG